MKNSYFKALSGLFALCALLVGGGCDDSDSEVNEKPYAISVSQNEMAAYYRITAPTAAGAGETVSVEVEVTSENHYLKFVSANGGPASRLPATPGAVRSNSSCPNGTSR